MNGLDYYVVSRTLKDIYITPQSKESAFGLKSIEYVVGLARERNANSGLIKIELLDRWQQAIPFIEFKSWRLSFNIASTGKHNSLQFTVSDHQTSKTFYTTWDGNGISHAIGTFRKWTEYLSFADEQTLTQLKRLEECKLADKAETIALSAKVNELTKEVSSLKKELTLIDKERIQLQEENKVLKLRIAKAKKDLSAKL